MPTKPLEKVLNRDLSRASAREFAAIACPLLRELVNNGTHVFMRCWSSSSGDPNENAAPLILYLHIVEFVDAIEELLPNSCMVPAVPLVRSCFEALLQLEYILDNDGCYVERSLSWLKRYAKKRVAYHEFLDPTTCRGRPIARHLAADKDPVLARLPAAEEARERACSWRRLLSDPKLSGCSSFPNTDDLSKKMRRHAQYTYLYRRWSSIAHAEDLLHAVVVDSGGHAGVRRLRDPREGQQVAVCAAHYILHATLATLRKFRPGEERSTAQWYRREVKNPLETLSNLEIDFVEFREPY